MEKIKQFLSFFKDKPLWVRVLITVLLVSVFSIYLLCSCGQTVKVTVKDTPTGVSISTSQSKQDSSGTNIHINPNISFPNGN